MSVIVFVFHLIQNMSKRILVRKSQVRNFTKNPSGLIRAVPYGQADWQIYICDGVMVAPTRLVWNYIQNYTWNWLKSVTGILYILWTVLLDAHTWERRKRFTLLFIISSSAATSASVSTILLLLLLIHHSYDWLAAFHLELLQAILFKSV
jgi:hypothetical protein